MRVCVRVRVVCSCRVSVFLFVFLYVFYRRVVCENFGLVYYRWVFNIYGCLLYSIVYRCIMEGYLLCVIRYLPPTGTYSSRNFGCVRVRVRVSVRVRVRVGRA